MTVIGKADEVIVADHSLPESPTSKPMNDLDQQSDERKLTLRQRIAASIWDTFDKSPEDRKLVTKIDWFIMTYVCLAYFVKYLDQTNVSARPRPLIEKDSVAKSAS